MTYNQGLTTSTRSYAESGTGTRIRNIALWIAGVTDVATFAVAISLWGIGAESNPIARFIFDNTGLIGIVALKGAAILGILWLNMKWITYFGVGLWTFGAITNTLAILIYYGR